MATKPTASVRKYPGQSWRLHPKKTDAWKWRGTKADVLKDEAGHLCFGSDSIGASPAERRRFWREAARVERKRGWLQARLIAEVPHWLPPAEIRKLIRSWCEAEFGARGLAWYASVHGPDIDKGSDERNIHVHIVYCPRPVTRVSEGHWKFSPTKLREINGPRYPWGTEAPTRRVSRTQKRLNIGQRRGYPLGPAEIAQLRADLNEAEIVARLAASNRRTSGWLRRTWISDLRASYARSVNEHLLAWAKAGGMIVRLYDARSYRDAGVRKPPTRHQGQKSTYTERAGTPTPAGRANRRFEYAWLVQCEASAEIARTRRISEIEVRVDQVISAVDREWLQGLAPGFHQRARSLIGNLSSSLKMAREIHRRDKTRLAKDLSKLDGHQMVPGPRDDHFWLGRRLKWVEARDRELAAMYKHQKRRGIAVPRDARGREIGAMRRQLRRVKQSTLKWLRKAKRTPGFMPASRLHPALMDITSADAKRLLERSGVSAEPTHAGRAVGECLLPNGEFVGDGMHGDVGRALLEIESSLMRFPMELKLIERDSAMRDAEVALAHCIYNENYQKHEKHRASLRQRTETAWRAVEDEVMRLGGDPRNLRAVAALAHRCVIARSSGRPTGAQELEHQLALATGTRAEPSRLQQLWRRASCWIRDAKASDSLNTEERSRLTLLFKRAEALEELQRFKDCTEHGYPLHKTGLELLESWPRKMAEHFDARVAALDREIIADPVGRLVASMQEGLGRLRQDDAIRTSGGNPTQEHSWAAARAPRPAGYGSLTLKSPAGPGHPSVSSSPSVSATGTPPPPPVAGQRSAALSPPLPPQSPEHESAPSTIIRTPSSEPSPHAAAQHRRRPSQGNEI